MTVTTTGLTRAAGISAAAAGLLFIGIQIRGGRGGRENLSKVVVDARQIVD